MTNFSGFLKSVVPGGINGEPVTVGDISLTGIRFKAARPNMFRKNQVLEIDFFLDDHLSVKGRC
jgi:hypothetical protein